MKTPLLTIARRLKCTHCNERKAHCWPEPIRIGDLVRWRWVDVEKAIKSLEAGDDFHVDANDPYFAGIERGKTQKANH